MTTQRTISRARRTVGSFVALAVLTAGAAACSDDETSAKDTTVTVAEADGAPLLDDPSATGGELAEEFLMILQDQDMEALDAFLADGFQLQRADGTGATKAEYLADPAKVGEFTLGAEVVGVQDRGVLTVRWSVKVQEEIDGVATDTGEAARLSTFLWQGGRWRMLSHANFVLPAGDAPDTDGDAAAGTEATRVLFAQADPANAAGQTLYLQQVTIPVGVALAKHIHEGTQLATIQSGVLTYHVEENTATVVRSDGTREQFTGPTVIELRAGDSVIETADMVHWAENEGDVPVVILLATLLAKDAPMSTPRD